MTTAHILHPSTISTASKTDSAYNISTKNISTKDKTSPNASINAEMDLSDSPLELPQIFSDYYFHTGPLRADPPPVMEWPQRIPDNQASRKLKTKYAEKLQDCYILADTCRRAKKYRQYANCFMCMGIIFDNCKDYKNAIESYKQFLNILIEHIIIPVQNQSESHSQNINTTDIPTDTATDSTNIQSMMQSHTSIMTSKSIEFDLGLYAAYNALGVDYQLLADFRANSIRKNKFRKIMNRMQKTQRLKLK